MGFVAQHLPCDDCGSSDARSVDDKGWSHCFSCQTNRKDDGLHVVGSRKVKKMDDNFENTRDDFLLGDFVTLTDRGITSATAKQYKVLKQKDQILFGYYNAEGMLSAAKVRKEGKQFRTTGEWAEGVLFGQQLFNKGGKYVTITEGEIDACSAYQMLGSKYPVVSVRNGAGSAIKDCKAQYEWLNSFENIVVMFDNDEVGRNAAQQVAKLFGGKSRVAKYPEGLKDANDFLMANKSKEFVDCFWRAERYKPEGIVCTSEMLDKLLAPRPRSIGNYPFEGLNALTYGVRPYELVTVTAGSGLGKSQFLREILYHLLQTTDFNIGALFLEESDIRTVESIMSVHANKLFHLDPDSVGTEEYVKAFKETHGTERIHLAGDFGSSEIDDIVSKVRELALAMDCKIIFLDHISIIVSAQSNGDERKAIDELMTKLRMLVQETGIVLFAVSHLKRSEGKGHEEGASTSLGQLRGSQSIAQLSDMVLGLERHAQADDEQTRNTTQVRVLKNRFAGVTGKACSLLYTHSDGRMRETYDAEEL